MRKRNLLLAAGACLATFTLAVGTAVADPNDPQQFRQPAGVGQPATGNQALSRPYFPLADWLWNKIPTGPALDPQSSTWAALLSAPGAKHVADIIEYGVALRSPAEITGSTPRQHITFAYETGQIPGGWAPNPFGTDTMPIPASLPIPPGSDGQVAVADPTTNTVYSVWQTVNTGGTYSGSWGAKTSLSGDGIDDRSVVRGASSTGSRLHRFAAVVRASEIQAGVIPHALFVSTDMAAPSVFRYPAGGTDGANLAGVATPIPEGTRIQLDSSIDLTAIPGITRFELIIGKALQDYGAYIGDNGGARLAVLCEFLGTDAASNAPYTNAGAPWDYFDLTHLPWGQVRALA